VNNCAFTTDNGATVPTNAFNDEKNRVNPVRGADKYRATGSKCNNNTGNFCSVSLIAPPRPANVFPNPTKFC